MCRPAGDAQDHSDCLKLPNLDGAAETWRSVSEHPENLTLGENQLTDPLRENRVLTQSADVSRIPVDQFNVLQICEVRASLIVG